MSTLKKIHPAIAPLAQELMLLINNAPTRPTRKDRNELVAVRDKIKHFNRAGLDETAQHDIAGLYVMATRAANQQEDYYEQNGNKWAD